MLSPKTAGVKFISELFVLISLLGVRLIQKLFSKSASSIYMVMKSSRCVLLTSFMVCFTTLAHTLLYVCVILSSLFSITVPSPKSHVIASISLFVSHCSVLVNGIGVCISLCG